MKTFKALIILFLFLFLSSGFSYAIKVEKVPYASFFHLGLVFGPGVGLNFGANFLMPVSSLFVGAEGDIVVTNYEMNANINARRVGVVARYDLLENITSFSLHFGKTWFTSSRLFQYNDAFSQKSYTIYADEVNSANYLAGSFDFVIFENYILTPKVCLNYIDGGGTIFEYNINLSVKF